MSIYLDLPQLTPIQVWFVFGPILFALSTAQDGSGSGIAIDNVQLGDDMLLQLKKVILLLLLLPLITIKLDMLIQLKRVKNCFSSSSALDDNGTGHVAPTEIKKIV